MSIWVVLVNAWHIFLIVNRKGASRPPTISEHAAEARRLLWIHRFIHSLPLIVFIPMIFGYLVPSGHLLAAYLLMSGVIFDSLEALTLNKRTAPVDSPFNMHHFTTWIMSLSYFAFAIAISRIAEVSPWLYLPILTACVVLLIIAGKKIIRGKFLVMQMSYFLLLSSVILIANIKLILS